jgi:hypothetical protein
MPEDEQDHSHDSGESIGTARTPWFGANRFGLGVHPQTWQGWLVLLLPIAAIITIVVLIRTGSL